MWTDLVELVLPRTCGGCGVPGRGSVCPLCTEALGAATPGPAVPSPAPAGFPRTTALGPYDGVLRELLLAYKERGRHDLARPLGSLLGAVVSTVVHSGPLVLVPVPSTARAARARYGDHLARLTVYAARTLRRGGWRVAVGRPLQAVPRPDSTALDRAGRARAAEQAFRVRPAGLRRAGGAWNRAGGARVVLLDDIVTTGATLAAVSAVLSAAGLVPYGAAVLAATQLRAAPPPYAAPPVRVLRAGTNPMAESAGGCLSNEG